MIEYLLTVIPIAVATLLCGYIVALRLIPYQRQRVAVLVLGDLGHSPRMQNHVLSLVQNGFEVDFIGYKNSQLRQDISKAANLICIPSPAKIRTLNKQLFILLGLWRSISQTLRLFWILIYAIRKPEYLLIQNPPAIPTLLVARLVTILLGNKLIIDWHNFGYSLMSDQFAKNKLLFLFLTKYEQWCGSGAFLHLCVTEAMAKELQFSWQIRGKVVVLYDKPAAHFKQISPIEQHNLFSRLDMSSQTIQYKNPNSNESELIFTKSTAKGLAELKPDRPALIVSCTSWTPDEDFGILFRALSLYDCAAQDRLTKNKVTVPLSKLIVIITGKGPLRSSFEQLATDLKLQHVSIKFAWLEPQDYPILVAAADLGISLHTSSSGLDLPMKIIDMFGCGTPVCTYYYPTICELVQNNQNGVYFQDETELFKKLVDLIGNFPAPNASISTLIQGVGEFKSTWENHWRERVLPLIQ
ncbi:mannosyltransferase [Batrachochytrium dendrobatidis]|nr:mannosyltransferase [Batrachochytrium dendrobatidis]